MSKGAVRFPESAIAGGRVGTARIHSQIAGAAARLASDEHVPLDASIARIVGLPPGVKTDKPTPLQRMQALGRLGTGRMNKTEAAYAQLLDVQRHGGSILWFRFEGVKLRLADNTFFTPDFAVIAGDAQLEFHEVKGLMRDDANVKIKVAAAQYPFIFKIVRKAKGGAWNITTV